MTHYMTVPIMSKIDFLLNKDIKKAHLSSDLFGFNPSGLFWCRDDASLKDFHNFTAMSLSRSPDLVTQPECVWWRDYFFLYPGADGSVHRLTDKWLSRAAPSRLRNRVTISGEKQRRQSSCLSSVYFQKFTPELSRVDYTKQATEK